jgi:hypothetical protein
MNFKIFSPKNLAKILAFFAQTAANFLQKVIMTLVFEKNANFRNTITSDPGQTGPKKTIS